MSDLSILKVGKIQNNVPLPDSRGGRAPSYPFASMKVGDSVYVEDRAGTSHGTPLMRRVSSATSWYRRSLGYRFSIRLEGAGVRVWRVE